MAAQPSAIAVRNMRVTLRDVKLFAYHGVYAYEKEQGTLFSLDLEIALDASRAVAEDTIAATIDYSELYKCAIEFSTTNRFDLLETWAARLADYLLTTCMCAYCKITIRKPGTAVDRNVGTIEVSYEAITTSGKDESEV